VDLLHVHLQVVCTLEDLSTVATWMWDEPTLMLVANVSEQGALQVEAAAAGRTTVLHSLRRLAEGVDGMLLGAVQPLQPHGLVGTVGLSTAGTARP
jgi:hypothetical protein